MGGIYARKAVEKEELDAICRLRYKVYVEEWGFERAEDHPGGLERDDFDANSVHFIEFDTGNEVIGTARIILHSEKGFPIESHCKIDADTSGIDRARIGEISRLAISKEFRRRAEDRLIYEGTTDFRSDEPKVTNEKRKRQEIVLNLYKCIYVESKLRGITHWYAVMAKGLYLLLKRTGIVFSPIGPEVYYHGLRAPYLGRIADIEAGVAKVNPDLLSEFRETLARP